MVATAKAKLIAAVAANTIVGHRPRNGFAGRTGSGIGCPHSHSPIPQIQSPQNHSHKGQFLILSAKPELRALAVDSAACKAPGDASRVTRCRARVSPV